MSPAASFGDGGDGFGYLLRSVCLDEVLDEVSALSVGDDDHIGGRRGMSGGV